MRREILFAVALLAMATPSFGGSPPSLRFDPFRPKPKVNKVVNAVGNASPNDAFEPILLSTVVGGEHPLVNLGGEILEVGEQSHGYRLIEVNVFDATFVKDGEKLRLEILSGERTDQ